MSKKNHEKESSGPTPVISKKAYKKILHKLQIEFEHMRSGIKLLKYYLDISKPEQKQRLNERKREPLTQWKVSTLEPPRILWRLHPLRKWSHEETRKVFPRSP
ncbi:MAG: hypothetical protein ACSLEZ_05020 [Thiobacillus sp.]